MMGVLASCIESTGGESMMPVLGRRLHSKGGQDMKLTGALHQRTVVILRPRCNQASEVLQERLQALFLQQGHPPPLI